MAKQAHVKSRPQRWRDAADRADAQRDILREEAGRLAAILSELDELRSEYEEWRDNLPENMQQGATAEKLDAICDLDFSASEPLEAWDEVDDAIESALNADLPLGFGRD